MAELVRIRHKSTGHEQTVPKSAAVFFPEYEVLDKTGRKAAHQPTPEKKD